MSLEEGREATGHGKTLGQLLLVALLKEEGNRRKNPRERRERGREREGEDQKRDFNTLLALIPYVKEWLTPT